ncbi:methyltransferase [Aurantiacibacter poecillastricola]|uniref:methyltransferase n=1 Tax=Aurantiacibacter poecillastricola TaxID=3064385 RepID=UPI00273DA065|nr:methyltransferase [Aurantiacibacter sp. 219JJ12-13]MDP5260375.1 methyltransferase [Aurantiacibacter sp. 219JJ12-13]
MAPPGWKIRWIGWRNRVIGDPVFQHWAARLPLVRRVARSRASRLFDLLAGFTYSQVLLAAVESGLLDLLGEGPATLSAIAGRTSLPEVAALRLVRAATALDIAEEVSNGCWMLGQQGAALHTNRGAQAMIRHHRLLYDDLADPLALLRANRSETTALSEFWRYAAQAHPGDLRNEGYDEYSELMATTQAMVCQQALGAYDFGQHRSVLDVGGGHGTFASALAAAYPHLRLGIVDLPQVLEGTGARLRGTAFEDRVTLHPADFFRDPLPMGYDCITLVRILHDHDDEPALRLLHSARGALGPGGRIMIAEPMAETSGAIAMGDAYFGMYLWAMRQGRPRSADEIAGILESAGFTHARHVTTAQPVVLSVVVACS